MESGCKAPDDNAHMSERIGFEKPQPILAQCSCVLRSEHDKWAYAGSSDQIVHNAAVDVCQPKVATCVTVSELLVIESDQL